MNIFLINSLVILCIIVAIISNGRIITA